MDSTEDVNLLQSALGLANQGLPVFPCNSCKKPLTTNGFKDATTDPVVIRNWWTKHPGALIGIPTGAITGVIVVDVDLPEGPATLASLEAEHGLLPPTLEQKTASGGRHLLFKHPGFSIKNSAGKIGPGIDVRADGGYIIAAPSHGYCWQNSLPIATAPLWLLTLIVGRADKEAAAGSHYGHAALSAEIVVLKNTPEGGRNARLNVAAFSLGQLVAGGELDHEKTVSALLAGALEIGLSESEACSTITSGISAGSQQPRQGKATHAPTPEIVSITKFRGLFVDGNALLSVKSKIDYTINGIIESNTMGMIFGPSGEAKSFNADAMACCCATGLPWAGHATKKGLVVYLNGEGFLGKSRRVRAWAIKHGFPDLSNFVISRQVVNLESDIGLVIEEINGFVATKGVSPVLLIIDTLARHLYGDENSSKDVMKFLSMVEYLRSQFLGCSVILITHTGNDEANFHRARGSSALKAAMDFEILCNKGLLAFTKMKDGEVPKGIEFKLVPIDISNDDETGEVITSCIVEYGERSEANKTVSYTKVEETAIAALLEVSIKDNRNLNGKYVADSNAWKTTFFRLRKAEDIEVSPAALKKAFQRVVSSLTNKRFVEQIGTYSFLVSTQHQEEIREAVGQGTLLDMSP